MIEIKVNDEKDRFAYTYYFKSRAKIKSVGVNKIIGFSVYENAKDSVGQSEYSIITRDLKDLSNIYNNCKALCNSDNQDSTKRILGTKHKDKTIVNRLINNI